MSSPQYEAITVNIPLAGSAVISAIVLTFQRVYHHVKAREGTIRLPEDGELDLPSDEELRRREQLGDVPDPNQRFSTRVWDVLKLILSLAQLALSAFFLAWRLIHLDLEDEDNKFSAIGSLLSLIAWSYTTVLTLVSLRYKLPNSTGWILNTHVACLSLAAFCTSVYQSFTLSRSTRDLPEILVIGLLVNLGLTFAMTAVTWTLPRGPQMVTSKGKIVTPVDSASLFSFLAFTWVAPIIHEAYQSGHMKIGEVWYLPPQYRGRNVFPAFTKDRGRRLFIRMIKANKFSMMMQISMAAIGGGLYYAPAFFMKRLLDFIQTHQRETGYVSFRILSLEPGYLALLGYLACAMILAITNAQLWYWSSSAMQIHVLTSLNMEIYAKTLKRRDVYGDVKTDDKKAEGKKDAIENREANGEVSSVDSANKDNDKKEKDEDETADVTANTGTIVNLMSTDANRVSEYATWWFVLVDAPIELIIGIFFLWKLLGWSALIGLLVMIITLPINHYSAKAFTATQDKLMKARDSRVALMNEILQGVRQIKYFAWERRWEEKVMAKREEELGFLRKNFMLEVCFHLLWGGSPILVTIIAFISFTIFFGNELTPPIAFTSIAVFNELRFALNVLPETFVEAVQAYVSVRRIEKYLNEPEVETQPDASYGSGKGKIGFEDATITWNAAVQEKDENQAEAETDGGAAGPTSLFKLTDVSVEFPRNELSIICGPTGSGKTLMLLGLLGESDVTAGKSYCPRAPVFDDDLGGESEDDDDDDADADSTQDIPTAPRRRFSTIPASAWILPDAVAYVSQAAWLQNATIRDNITFGTPFDAVRYHAVLEACALVRDLEILEDGDETEIGEKGITLSGGQKQRVSLARAVYSRAGVIILDDVLSAVDAHTAKHIYQKCLMGPLMANRTRILVTHHVRMCVTGANYLVNIREGRVQHVGKVADLRERSILKEVVEEEEKDRKEDEEPGTLSAVPSMTDVTSAESTADEVTLTDGGLGGSIAVDDGDAPKKKKERRVLVEEESSAIGIVKLGIYKTYMLANGSWLFWLLLFVIFFGDRCLEVGEGWWVKLWSASYAVESTFTPPNHFVAQGLRLLQGENLSSFSVRSIADYYAADAKSEPQIMVATFVKHSVVYYLAGYILITFSSIILGAVRFGVTYYGSLKASRILYERMLRRILRAPMRFFDTTPVGRILNRFAKDFESVDSGLPNNFAWFFIQVIGVISVIGVVSSISPWFLGPMLLLCAFFYYLAARYASTSRQMKRMNSNAKSPLFTHFTETIVGVTTIRAFGVSRRFMLEMIKRTDVHARPFFFTWTVNRWLSTRSSATGALLSFAVGVAILWNLDFVDASLAGFTLTYAFTFTDQLFWGVRRYTSLELSLNSVERIVEYSELEEEAPEIIEPRPPASWPEEGKIEVKDLQVRYAADLDPVLHGINFSVKSQEKIGIVGRTGSGKSTLALSFFRFIEASRGSIIIDGKDISQIGLSHLRSRLTIIPQDPTLFSGTLRSNLDPFDQYTDAEVFESLRRVHLLPSDDDQEALAAESRDVNANVFRDLDAVVSEGGKNFSQGQRQLLCLARALLKRSKIVMMDEATASVDLHTDEAIQKTIRSEFVDCTILCIAHRLLTVIDYDRILVLDQGNVAEYDTPRNLIEDTNSIFYTMCRMTFQLFKDTVPKTAENFRALCTGEKGTGVSGKPLHYKNSVFHREEASRKNKAKHDFLTPYLDFTRGDGRGGESIYGQKFADENFTLKHGGRGTLSMANAGPASYFFVGNTNGSQFFICFGDTPWLDGRHTVLGQLTGGKEVLDKIEAEGSQSGATRSKIEVTDCGEVKE
ncbi:hypothetical protein BZG36_00792 [Bifiguratus adelaidae]|uniref:Uncharacterized protein n=1 Tax=Bifiguratus adelaidae TaxID=1938954 RepID=A0A261Y6N9_9FUNG|nr:hypothetical protein BZG36_00792 [Bifiguratus adelaidae]